MEVQSDSLLYDHENEERILLSCLQQYGFVVKRLLKLKTCLKKQQGGFKRTKIVLIRVHLETGC